MGRINFQCSDDLQESVDQLAKEYGISRSELLRSLMRNAIHSHREKLPDHLKKNTSHEKLKSENKHRLRSMWFKSNRMEDLKTMRDAVNPPHPRYVFRDWFVSYVKEISLEHFDRSDDYYPFLWRQFETYCYLHPAFDIDNETRYSAIVETAARNIKMGHTEMAEQSIQDAIDRGVMPPGKDKRTALDHAHEVARQAEWGEEWSKKVGTIIAP